MTTRTRTTDITYVDAAPTPAANYVGTYAETEYGMPYGPVRRVERPPLTGHVHVRTSDRCIHNDAGPLCPDPTR